MHTATDLSLLRVQEELDRLLDSYGFEKTEPVRPSGVCSGQLIPDTVLSFSSVFAGANPSLN